MKNIGKPNARANYDLGSTGRMVKPTVISYLLLVGGAVFAAACLPIQANTVAPLHVSTVTATAPLTDTVHLAGGEWAPYAGKDLPHHGCDAWVITEAFALEGITVTYDFFPWARSYQYSQNGDWDGTFEWADTPAFRQTHYLSSDYLSKQEWVFFHRRDRPFEWSHIDDLAGKTIGVTNGYAYSDALEELRQKGSVTFSEARNDELNFKKLLAGRVDIFPMERQVGYAIMSTLFTPNERAQITHHPRLLTEFLPHLLLSKAVPQNQQRMELFNRGFQQLQASGRYAEIMQNCACLE